MHSRPGVHGIPRSNASHALIASSKQLGSPRVPETLRAASTPTLKPAICLKLCSDLCASNRLGCASVLDLTQPAGIRVFVDLLLPFLHRLVHARLDLLP